jgi:hypothetical protein
VSTQLQFNNNNTFKPLQKQYLLSWLLFQACSNDIPNSKCKGKEKLKNMKPHEGAKILLKMVFSGQIHGLAAVVLGKSP